MNGSLPGLASLVLTCALLADCSAEHAEVSPLSIRGAERQLPGLEFVVSDSAGRGGAPILDIVDVTFWQDSVAVLDQQGVVWILDPEARRVARALSIGQSFQTPIGHALSLLTDGTSLGVWDVLGRHLYWIQADGSPAQRMRIPVDSLDLFMSWRNTEPPRMFGRMFGRGPDLYLELRSGSQQDRGARVDAAVVRVAGLAIDTVLSFEAPSDAHFLAGLWVCCNRPRYFTPQPWWAVLSDGTFVFADGGEPRLALLHGRSLTKSVTWEVEADPMISAGEMLEYLYRSTERRFADSSDHFLADTKEQIRARFSRFSGSFNHTAPAFTQLAVDDRDRLWVRRFERTRWPEGLSITWDVFDRELGYLGMVRLPGVDHVYRIRAGRVVGSQILHGRLERVLLVPVEIR